MVHEGENSKLCLRPSASVLWLLFIFLHLKGSILIAQNEIDPSGFFFFSPGIWGLLIEKLDFHLHVSIEYTSLF